MIRSCTDDDFSTLHSIINEAAAHWAIRLYERHGFKLVPTEKKDQLLSTYWNISVRQKEKSVVLVMTET